MTAEHNELQQLLVNVLVIVLPSPADNDEVADNINFTQFVIRRYSECYCLICILYFRNCTEM